MLTPFSAAGYRARIYAVEWHANLWRLYGTPVEYCERMMRFCSECVDCDFYGESRPTTDDPHIARMQAYLDNLFAQPADSFPGGVSFA